MPQLCLLSKGSMTGVDKMRSQSLLACDGPEMRPSLLSLNLYLYIAGKCGYLFGTPFLCNCKRCESSFGAFSVTDRFGQMTHLVTCLGDRPAVGISSSGLSGLVPETEMKPSEYYLTTPFLVFSLIQNCYFTLDISASSPHCATHQLLLSAQDPEIFWSPSILRH